MGDSFDNALAETVIGLYKTELIRGPNQGPWDSAIDVELATLGWVHGTTTSGYTPISATSRRQSSRRPTLPEDPTNKRLETNKPTLRESQGGSHRFDAIFGRREDSESVNADYKSRLWNGRCRTMGHHSVDFGNIAYQAHTIITALVAYCGRTNTDTTRWFGQLQLVPKRPLALAA